MSWFPEPETSNFTNAEHLKGQLELFWPKHRNLTHKVGKILRKSLFFSLGKIGNWLLQNRNLSPGEGKWGTSNVDNLTRIYSLFFFNVYLTYHHIPITVGFSLSFEFAIFGVQRHTPNLEDPVRRATEPFGFRVCPATEGSGRTGPDISILGILKSQG